MNEVLKKISSYGIVPVIKIDDTEKAVPLANALCAGGLPVAEVTFRTAQAAEAISRITKEVPDMLVGAGTVLTCEQVDSAVAAGAKFIVSPGLNVNLVKYCIDKEIPIVPGTSTPSDMEAALDLGLETVKFFPAEQAGGIAFLKAVSAPFTNLKFMPTGGINAANLNDYLAFSKVIACGGTWMVKSDLIEAGNFSAITELTREAVKNMLGFELAHIGINCENESQAAKTAQTICTLFGLDYKPGNSSIFAGSAVECMKTPYLGRNGHIAIMTNSIERAVTHLTSLGVRFDESTRKTDAKGVTKAIYLADEIAGFAIHLLQK
jgi:2-dehydro-3-deoxyphosphogluconate aldolase/(4S)-4-hydroxy-2-oxoglutarate aldolase